MRILRAGSNENVPELVFGVELAEEKHLDARAGLLLVAVEEGGEDFGVVENHHIALVEEVDDFFENMMGDFARGAVDHHHACHVAVLERMLGNEFGRQVEFELR